MTTTTTIPESHSAAASAMDATMQGQAVDDHRETAKSGNQTASNSRRMTKFNKQSKRIKKIPAFQVQKRPPLITHAISPKIIHTNPSNFMKLVQSLTGSSATRLRWGGDQMKDSICKLPASPLASDDQVASVEEGSELCRSFAAASSSSIASSSDDVGCRNSPAVQSAHRNDDDDSDSNILKLVSNHEDPLNQIVDQRMGQQLQENVNMDLMEDATALHSARDSLFWRWDDEEDDDDDESRILMEGVEEIVSSLPSPAATFFSIFMNELPPLSPTALCM